MLCCMFDGDCVFKFLALIKLSLYENVLIVKHLIRAKLCCSFFSLNYPKVFQRQQQTCKTYTSFTTYCFTKPTIQKSTRGMAIGSLQSPGFIPVGAGMWPANVCSLPSRLQHNFCVHFIVELEQKSCNGVP